MKYTGPITEAQIASLTAAKAQLAKHLKQIGGAEKTLATHTAQLATLDTEQTGLAEKARSGLDRKAIQDLDACHRQSATISGHLDTAHADAAHFAAGLRTVVDHAAAVISGIVGKGLQEQLTAQVGAAMSPFFHRMSSARYCLRETDAIREFGNFLNPPVPFDAPALARLGRRLIATIDALLAGGELWTFTARADFADGFAQPE